MTAERLTERLAEKVALITGGGTGIGAAIARRFVQSGAKVVITGRRSEPLQAVVSDIGCEAVVCDVGVLESCTAAVNETVKLFGGLDILVSNAGVLYEGSVVEQEPAEWQQSFDTNVTGVMNMARVAIPQMVTRGGGAIVNVSSVAGIASGAGMASYVSSKTAVLGLTRSLAVDYGPQGIRVNTLCPGWVKTPMSDAEMQALAEQLGISADTAAKETTRYLPLRRMAEADEIAACAEFLASDDASFVTGTVLVADGGGDSVDVGTLSLAELSLAE